MMVTPDPVRNTPTAPGGRIGMSDVRRLAESTRTCRMLDYRYGGGTPQPTVLSLLRAGQNMLTATMSDRVFDQLCVAVADLHNLAGWTSFDIGRVATAMAHFQRGLELARAGRNADLLANIHYRIGRVRLHHDQPDAALTQFALGLRAAAKVDSGLAKAILVVNQGWAHAKQGRATEAVALLDRAGDELAAADLAAVPPWSTFFSRTDLAGTVGVIHTELAAAVHLGHAGVAIPALTEALAGYGENMARSRAFCLTALATAHILRGDLADGASIGILAVDLATTLTSARTRDRMHALTVAARQHQRNGDIRDLLDRVDRFVTAPAG